jgi:hypothetical protein
VPPQAPAPLPVVAEEEEEVVEAPAWAEAAEAPPRPGEAGEVAAEEPEGVPEGVPEERP